MKGVFDACCTAPSQVVGTTTATSPHPGDPAMKQQTGPMQRVGQPVSNMLQKVEQKMPVVAPMAGSLRQFVNSAAGLPDIDRLNANVVTGQGEVSQKSLQVFVVDEDRSLEN